MTLPFENNTTQVVKRLANRSLQADKRRNFFVIITIVLTTALLSGMVFILLASQRKLENDIRGQYQAVVMDTTQAEITHLSTQPEIEQWGLSQNFGTARYQDSNLVVEYADEGWMVLGKKPSYVGTLPQAENEILVEQAFLDYFNLPQELGQKICLNLGTGEQEYIVSGILQAENTSRMFSVIVSRAFLEAQADGAPLFEFRFRFEGINRADLDALKADIAAFLTENGISENRVFYSSNYFDMRGFQSNSVYIYFPIALIFLAACGLVIYSIFFISVRGKLREYGRLKVIGATPRQIRRVISRESIRLSVWSIPLGLLIGAAVGFAANISYWSWLGNLPAAISVSIFTVLIVMISTRAPIRLAAKVSPIEAVRSGAYQTEAPKKSTRKSGKHISPSLLAIMNFQRNPKKAVLTLISLSMTGVFLFSAATLLRSINVNNMAANNMKDDCNYSIEVESSTMEEFPETLRNNPLTPELRQKILEVDGVKSITPRTGSTAVVSLSNNVSTDMDLHAFTQEEMKELIPDDLLLEGTADYDTLVQNHGVVVTDNKSEPMLSLLYDYEPQIGDIVVIEPYGGEPMEFTIMGIADSQKASHAAGYGAFAVPIDLARQLYPDIENMERIWNVFTDEDTDTLRDELFSLLEDPQLSIVSRSDYAQQLGMFLHNTMMIVYGLLMFLFLFALVNLVNTLMTNLLSRKQEFGVLQSVGMSGRQLSKMLTIECFCYVAATLLITLVLGGLVGSLLVVVVNKAKVFGTLVYQFPIWELLIFAASLLFVQALYSIFAVRYMRRQSLVERIKTME